MGRQQCVLKPSFSPFVFCSGFLPLEIYTLMVQEMDCSFSLFPLPLSICCATDLKLQGFFFNRSPLSYILTMSSFLFTNLFFPRLVSSFPPSPSFITSVCLGQWFLCKIPRSQCVSFTFPIVNKRRGIAVVSHIILPQVVAWLQPLVLFCLLHCLHNTTHKVLSVWVDNDGYKWP